MPIATWNRNLNCGVETRIVSICIKRPPPMLHPWWYHLNTVVLSTLVLLLVLSLPTTPSCVVRTHTIAHMLHLYWVQESSCMDGIISHWDI